jgi:hypothetical protein
MTSLRPSSDGGIRVIPQTSIRVCAVAAAALLSGCGSHRDSLPSRAPAAKVIAAVYPASRETTDPDGSTVRSYHFGQSAQFRKSSNGVLIVQDYGSLFFFRLSDASIYRGKSRLPTELMSHNSIRDLSPSEGRKFRGLSSVQGFQSARPRTGECEDCIAPPTVGFFDAHTAGTAGSRHTAYVSGEDPPLTVGPCDPDITQSDCYPQDPFGYTVQIRVGGSTGNFILQTCYYDGTTFDYEADVCFLNARGTIFNFHGPIYGTGIDYYRNVPGGTTHFINNVDVNAPPTYPQDYFAEYDDIKGGLGHDEDDHDANGRFYPSKDRRVDIYITLTRTRFSHMTVDWFNFGLGDSASNHTGSGEAFVARNNYSN